MVDPNGDIEIPEKMEGTPQSTEELGGFKIIVFNAEIPPEYRSFIFARWLKSLRYGNPFFRMIDSDSYYSSYSSFIEFILKGKNTILKVAVLANDPDVALGYSIDDGETLHYIYVKPEVRKQGISRELMNKNIKQFSHITNIGYSIWKDKLPGLKFNPFLERK
jgi:GNAT superfamily N-acetyltransferase